MILGFGLFWGSSISRIERDSVYSTETVSSAHFYWLVILEIIILLFISVFLEFRKWKLKDFNLHFTWTLPLIAVVLVASRLSIGGILRLVFEWSGCDLGQPIDLRLEASLMSCFLVIIVNSIYEEVLLLGYLFKRLEKFHPLIVILISMMIRESYHLYQGWYRLPMGISLGLVYGWYYYKYKKLWPPIMAHGITNALSFFSIYYHWEWMDW